MGSSSSSPQTTTTTSEPPDYLRDYLNRGVVDSLQHYEGGWGANVVPFSHQTEAALSMAEARARAGSPVNQAAQSYATNTLNGGMMGQNPFLQGGANPHLDAMFGKAAQATRNQLTSEFARSGRNVDAAQGIRGEQLNDLATQVYGGAYENDANRRLQAYQGERSLQQGLVPFAGQLASQDYADIGQLANVGAQHEALAQQYASAPAQNLDAYLARIQGFPGSTVTGQTPMERNRLAGALGGASAGAMLGPWGMLGGALLGGFYG